MPQPVSQVVYKALDFFHEWGLAGAKNGAAGSVTNDQWEQQIKWQKPADGMYKCNVDATLFASDNKYGVGLCIHTSTSDFLKGKTLWFNDTQTPQEAEAMGL